LEELEFVQFDACSSDLPDLLAGLEWFKPACKEMDWNGIENKNSYYQRSYCTGGIG